MRHRAFVFSDRPPRPSPHPLPPAFRPQPLTASLTLSDSRLPSSHPTTLRLVPSLPSPVLIPRPDLPLSRPSTLTPSRRGCSPTLESPGSSSASVRPASHACLPPNSSAYFLYPSPDITPVHFHEMMSGCSKSAAAHPLRSRVRELAFSLRGV